MKRLFIFDFDGTIVDSEPNYEEAGRTHEKELGFTTTLEERQALVGIGTHNSLSILRERYNIAQEVEELIRRADEIYMDIARSGTLVFPEMEKFILTLHEQGATMAISSGTSLALLHELVEQIGLKHCFKGIFSAEQVKQGKPAPDLFLLTANTLGFKPEQCLVFEDSQPGVLAAASAGMTCVALPAEERFAEDVFQQKARLVFPSGHHFSAKAMLTALEKKLI